MYSKFLFFGVWILVATSSAAFADRVRNGGRVTRCSGNSNFQSLDYIFAKEFIDNKKVLLPKVTSVEQSLERIAGLLIQKLPTLSDSFREFISLIGNQDPSKKYLWKVSKTGLYELDDEAYQNIPYQCRKNDKIEIEQAIVRSNTGSSRTKSDQIIFEFDSNIISEMKVNSPQQLSFLLVHEWLWNYTSSFEQNRKVDFLLHSYSLDELSSADANIVLQTLGLVETLHFK